MVVNNNAFEPRRWETTEHNWTDETVVNKTYVVVPVTKPKNEKQTTENIKRRLTIT